MLCCLLSDFCVSLLLLTFVLLLAVPRFGATIYVSFSYAGFFRAFIATANVATLKVFDFLRFLFTAFVHRTVVRYRRSSFHLLLNQRSDSFIFSIWLLNTVACLRFLTKNLLGFSDLFDACLPSDGFSSLTPSRFCRSTNLTFQIEFLKNDSGQNIYTGTRTPTVIYVFAIRDQEKE